MDNKLRIYLSKFKQWDAKNNGNLFLSVGSWEIEKYNINIIFKTERNRKNYKQN